MHRTTIDKMSLKTPYIKEVTKVLCKKAAMIPELGN